MDQLISCHRVSDKIFCEILVDGVAIVGTTWNFLEPKKLVDITFPTLIVIRESTKFLKGMKYFEGYYHLYTLNLFELSNFRVYLCFHDNKDSFIEFDKLINHIGRQMDKTLLRMQSSETYKLLKQSLLPKIAERKMKSGSTMPIFVSDYKRFGIIFSHLLNNKQQLNESQLPGSLQACFVGTIFGQAAPIKPILKNLAENIVGDLAQECCIHIAYDCVAEEKTILFHRKELKSRIKRRPSHEYFPNAICGASNCYFEFQKNPMQQIQITLVKMYSELYRYVHRSKEKPYKESKIGNFIVSYLTNSLHCRTVTGTKKLLETVDQYLEQVCLLNRLIELTSLNPSQKARIEAIVSLCNNSVTDFTVAAKNVHDFMLTTKLLEEKCFITVKTDLIIQRQKNYFEPCAKLLTYYLNSVKRHLLNTNSLSSDTTVELLADDDDVPNKFKICSFGPSNIKF